MSTTDSQTPRIVILGGMPRSGTNLARRLIGSHSQIAMPSVEFNFFGKLAAGHSVERIINDPHFRQRYAPDLSDIDWSDPCAVYRELLARYAALKQKPIPGEKTPRNEFHYARIRECLKGFDVRFIQMVRNPFDVIASYKNAPFRGPNPENDASTIQTVAQEWVRSASVGAARTLAQPDDYLMVRFEDLTAKTHDVTERICRVLGVGFEPERMLELSDYHGRADNTSFREESPVADEASTKIKRLDSRKTHLTAEEIQLVGQICGEVALALGYADPDFEVALRVAPADERSPRSYIQRITQRIGLGGNG